MPPIAAPALVAVERAVVATVSYSDIFDYPLTAAEIHRYLLDISAPKEVIDELLQHGELVTRHLATRDGYVTLRGREALVATRRRRVDDAARLWRQARRYATIIASLPFVRMVAVTGELAMDNVQPRSDIDYFIVTAPGRLWLCRMCIIGLVRVAALRGTIICPNYLVSERELVFEERNLYTAHEVTQMVPLSGLGYYLRLREVNPWVADFLPSASGPPRQQLIRVRGRIMQRLAERALRGRLGARLEGWEMRRKIRKLGGSTVGPSEASFSADWCKGHVHGHEQRILAAFIERLERIEGQVS